MRPLTLIALSSLFVFSPLSLVVAAEAIQAHADAQPEATSTWPIRMLSASEAQEPKAGARIAPPTVLARLAGTWTGILEYRDYQSDGRVKLPTLMRGDLAPDGQSVKLRFTYDDGPGKTVYGGFVLAFDAQEAIASKTEEEGSPDLYRVIGDLAAKGPEPITLVLWGRGTENGEAVDARETLTVSASSYELLRETRLKGNGEFQFRHVYRFTRDSGLK